VDGWFFTSFDIYISHVKIFTSKINEEEQSSVKKNCFFFS
jgi:hypothetical protein